MKYNYFIIIKTSFFILSLLTSNIYSAELPPQNLRTDLLLDTDKVFKNGYQVNLPIENVPLSNEDYQLPFIKSKKPTFSWELRSEKKDILQTAYQIRVASLIKNLENNAPDLWDSGKINSSENLNIKYQGETLTPGKTCYWQVRSWNNNNESEWSQPKAFRMSPQLQEDYHPSSYPILKTDEFPKKIQDLSDETTSLYFIDFAKASFATLRLTLSTQFDNESITIRIGESCKDGRVNRKPGATIRYSEYTLNLKKGTHTYHLQIHPDKRNTGSQAIKMPSYIGEVYPFRYCEIETKNGKLDTMPLVIRESATYMFRNTGFFRCDNDILNQIWELCRYTIKITSFCGIYVDGDRERIPYEADAIINQLSHYAVDNDFSMARVSSEYLITHPTWPTEWILQSIIIAWQDYLYTGDMRSLDKFYDDLKAKLLLPLADEKTFLISTRTGKQNSDLMESIHFKGKEIRDIVDWPQAGGFGQDKKPGESDYFVFQDYNAVVNAYHYQALYLMSKIAECLGKINDSSFFFNRALLVKENYNKAFYNSSSQNYRDGIGTDHSAIHSNMFPLAFNMVPSENIPSIMRIIQSKGMACSVYGSQFLMDAIYEAGDPQYGLERLTAQDDRSWYNMIKLGSTVTLEAWDNKYKNNLDWNHAWGSAPANIIMRKLIGVEPLSPGFSQIRIKPQIATLKWIQANVPTIRGTVYIQINHPNEKEFSLNVDIPAGTIAEIWIPKFKIQSPKLNFDLSNVKEISGYYILENIGSGNKIFTIEESSK